MSRHRRPPAPLHLHLSGTALITACAVLAGLVVLRTDGDPLRWVSAMLVATGLPAAKPPKRRHAHRYHPDTTPLMAEDLLVRIRTTVGSTSHRADALARSILRPSTRPTGTEVLLALHTAVVLTARWPLAALPTGEQVAAAVRAVGEWLLTGEHLRSLLGAGLALVVVGAAVVGSPAPVAVPTAALLLGGVTTGLVLAWRHRHDAVRAGSILGNRGGGRRG